MFASWQLGTRIDGDPECAAVRDHREATIMLRAENNALLGLLVAKGVFTLQEWESALEAEAARLSKDYEKRFPGFKAADYGMDVNTALARDTMQGWRP